MSPRRQAAPDDPVLDGPRGAPGSLKHRTGRRASGAPLFYKSWMSPTSLSGRCSRRRPIRAHAIPSRALGFWQTGRRGSPHAEPRRPIFVVLGSRRTVLGGRYLPPLYGQRALQPPSKIGPAFLPCPLVLSEWCRSALNNAHARITVTDENAPKSLSWVITATPWRRAVAAIQASCLRSLRPASSS
jgi:hypothetical protein